MQWLDLKHYQDSLGGQAQLHLILDAASTFCTDVQILELPALAELTNLTVAGMLRFRSVTLILCGVHEGRSMDTDLCEFVRGLPPLQRLQVIFCAEDYDDLITDALFDSLSLSCPHLDILKMKHVYADFTSNGLLRLLCGLPGLSFISCGTDQTCMARDGTTLDTVWDAKDHDQEIHLGPNASTMYLPLMEFMVERTLDSNRVFHFDLCGYTLQFDGQQHWYDKLYNSEDGTDLFRSSVCPGRFMIEASSDETSE